MKATAKLRYLRMAPRKVRLTANLIRGKKVAEAQRQLQFAAKHSALPVLKVLNSAVAAATNNFGAAKDNLYVSRVAVNEGPKLKRYRPRARGMAYEIQKKTSHVTLEVAELNEGARGARKKAPRAQAPKAEQEEPAKGRESAQKKTAPKPSLRPDQERVRPKERLGMRRFFRRKAV